MVEFGFMHRNMPASQQWQRRTDMVMISMVDQVMSMRGGGMLAMIVHS